MTYLSAFWNGLKLIPRCLYSFLEKTIVVLLVYAPASGILVIAAALIQWAIREILGVEAQTAMLIFKILASVCQIIPLSICFGTSSEEDDARYKPSTELSAAVCTVVIALIWLAF